MKEQLNKIESKWEEEFERLFPMLITNEVVWGQNTIMYLDIKNFISRIEKEAREEERQFILNILDGQDIADKQIGNKMGGTLAIREALKARII